MAPLVRIVEGALGPEGQVRLVVSGVSDLDGLTRAWASSGATIERRGERVHASTTVVALTRAAGRAREGHHGGAGVDAASPALQGGPGRRPGPCQPVEVADARHHQAHLSLGAERPLDDADQRCHATPWTPRAPWTPLRPPAQPACSDTA